MGARIYAMIAITFGVVVAALTSASAVIARYLQGCLCRCPADRRPGSSSAFSRHGQSRFSLDTACSRRHPLIVAALAFGAVSIGLAVFLIFDLRQPYTGVLRISPAAVEQAIGFLNT
jgi:Protein of unknown function (DUF4239)